jgi:hypothetical protein
MPAVTSAANMHRRGRSATCIGEARGPDVAPFDEAEQIFGIHFNVLGAAPGAIGAAGHGEQCEREEGGRDGAAGTVEAAPMTGGPRPTRLGHESSMSLESKRSRGQGRPARRGSDGRQELRWAFEQPRIGSL